MALTNIADAAFFQAELRAGGRALPKRGVAAAMRIAGGRPEGLHYMMATGG
jgi:hypothetical protein